MAKRQPWSPETGMAPVEERRIAGANPKILVKFTLPPGHDLPGVLKRRRVTRTWADKPEVRRERVEAAGLDPEERCKVDRLRKGRQDTGDPVINKVPLVCVEALLASDGLIGHGYVLDDITVFEKPDDRGRGDKPVIQITFLREEDVDFEDDQGWDDLMKAVWVYIRATWHQGYVYFNPTDEVDTFNFAGYAYGQEPRHQMVITRDGIIDVVDAASELEQAV